MKGEIRNNQYLNFYHTYFKNTFILLLYFSNNNIININGEGGIIIITKDAITFITHKIEAIFLPNGDKAVKLACCDEFVISLGLSSRVYESKISCWSSPKFEEVKELSDKIVVDVSGKSNFCFAVLNDRRVFGCGENI